MRENPRSWRLYRFMRGFLRVALNVFFRRVEVVGMENVPAVGSPVIFCGNHPNSLLDPALITVCCGRIVHCAAKDVLFESALLRIFMTPLGAVPIRRRQDHETREPVSGCELDNKAAFDALFEILAAGRAMAIFPEGKSHDDSELALLKTGAARIALGAAERHPELVSELAIVPVGLHYVTRNRFRSSVLLQFGEPITLDADWMAAHERDARQAARELTNAIETGLRGLTVNASDWGTLRVLDGVRRLYQPQKITLEQRVELMRRFNQVYPTVRTDPEVSALFARVDAYICRLAAAGLRDGDLERTPGRWEALAKVASHLTTLLVLVPLAIAGAGVLLPLGALVRYGSVFLAPRKDVVATTKLVAGALGVLGVYAALVVFAWWGQGWLVGLWVLCGIPVSGMATLKVLERVHALRTALKTLYRLVGYRAEIATLREERSSLRDAVHAAVDRFKPEDMERLFTEREDRVELG